MASSDEFHDCIRSQLAQGRLVVFRSFMQRADVPCASTDATKKVRVVLFFVFFSLKALRCIPWWVGGSRLFRGAIFR
jgi:hypothetical protein